MATTEEQWDLGARASTWLRPDEQILWRARPDRSIRWSARMVGGLALRVLGVIYVVGFAAFFLHNAPPVILVVGGGVFAAGLFLSIRGSLRVSTTKRNSWYAVTDQRAVAVTGPKRSVADTPLTSPVIVRRDERLGRATVLFAELPPSDGPPDLAAVADTIFSAELGLLSGTSQRYGRGAPTTLVFRSIDHVDGFATAARHVGFRVEVTPQLSVGELMGAYFGNASYRSHGTHGIHDAPIAAGAKPRRIRRWVSSRLQRRPYRLWSPLAPDAAIAKLHEQIAKRSYSPFSLGSSGTSPVVGAVTGWNVNASSADGYRNTLSWVFQGAVCVQGEGSWLIGTTGPPSGSTIFPCVWFGIALLIAIGGLIGSIAQLAGGKPPLAAIALGVAAVMTVAFVGIAEQGYRMSTGSWARVDSWLRGWLDTPATWTDGP